MCSCATRPIGGRNGSPTQQQELSLVREGGGEEQTMVALTGSLMVNAAHMVYGNYKVHMLLINLATRDPSLL